MSMLAGIKTGKKKKKAPLDTGGPTSTGKPDSNDNANARAAALLRQSLTSGAGLPASSSKKTSWESRQSVGATLARAHRDEDGTMNPIQPRKPRAPNKPESDMSVQELAAAERLQGSNNDVANVMRLGKKRKVKEKSMQNADSDEEEAFHTALLDRGTQEQQTRRDQHRSMHLHDKQHQLAKRCWWWMEAPTFDRRRLLALGDYVSLAAAPPSLALEFARHFYLVPIAHVESMAACDEHVWDEVVRFQTSLRRWAQSQQRDVLFVETILDKTGFWQTKLEAIVVPEAVASDAALYFASSLAEQADDHGTHQQRMRITADKPLRRTVPAGGGANFAYFYVEFAAQQGYAQLIESRSFPATFGVDTIAGMLEMGPPRLRTQKAMDALQESARLHAFLTQYQPFDWTRDLDK